MTAAISEALATVRERIDAAAREAERAPREVALCAVSKTHPAGRVAEALAAGHALFGENRVQEAEAKWPALREGAAAFALHLIGPLQTNKVRKALDLFDAIQTLDRPNLALALAREIDRTGRQPECYVQVNTGDEPQKAGVPTAAADAFIEACLGEYGLPVVGLMCIPPLDDEPSPHFALLQDMAARHGLDRLSMGMSADYETAIAFGATLVRVGTAVFGPRATSAA